MSNAILLHASPWSAKQMSEIAQGFDSNASTHIASLYQECDNTGLPGLFAVNLKKMLKSPPKKPSAVDIDAIKRCRFLRRVPIDTAMCHWVAIGNAWREILEETKPHVVISELMDSYVIDSLQKECARCGIEFLGLVTCFVNGYFRATTYGEYRHVREPSDDEVALVTRSLVDQDYRPKFVALSEHRFRREVLFRWGKNILRVAALGALSLIPRYRRINMIYGGFMTACEWVHLVPRVSLGREDWQQGAAILAKPVIYVPLQHVPEATIDYWCQDTSCIDYEEKLFDLIERYGNDFTFVFKEHPNVLGMRNPRFYSRFEKHSSVLFARTSLSSNDVIDSSDAVLVWTGSAGFEAALRGKPVLALSSTYYMSGNRFMVLKEATTSFELAGFINKVSAQPVTMEEQQSMVRHLLSGLLVGRIAFFRSFEAAKNQYTPSVEIGRRLRELVERSPEDMLGGMGTES